MQSLPIPNTSNGIKIPPFLSLGMMLYLFNALWIILDIWLTSDINLLSSHFHINYFQLHCTIILLPCCWNTWICLWPGFRYIRHQMCLWQNCLEQIFHSQDVTNKLHVILMLYRKETHLRLHGMTSMLTPYLFCGWEIRLISFLWLLARGVSSYSAWKKTNVRQMVEENKR